MNQPQQTGFFGHPYGLMTLFFTEMWERLSYYGMRAILILYMVGPLRFSDSKAGLIYGLYVGSVYLLSLPGGWIADRFLGQRKAVLYGGVLIMFGHISLAIPRGETFYLGLVLIGLGTGLLKPNVSTIVGQLYSAEDKRRDSGFALYYMGINVGAFGGPLIVGFLAQSETFRNFLTSHEISVELSWHFGFGAAAVGMFFGLIQYMFGDKHLGDAGLRPATPATVKDRRILFAILAALAAVPAIAGALAVLHVSISPDIIRPGVLVLLCAIAAGLFIAMFTRGQWSGEERNRLWVILLLFFGAVFFFAVFEQAGSTFTLFAERHTDNRVLGVSFPASYWNIVNSALIILLSPVFSFLWLVLERRPHKSYGPTIKFGMGLILVGVGCLIMLPAAHIAEGGGKAGPGWLVMLYLAHTCAELCLSPVGLSWTTRLAPARIAGLAMGIWFTGTAIGNYLSGLSAGLDESMSLHSVFLLIALVPIGAGAIFLLLAPRVRRLLQR